MAFVTGRRLLEAPETVSLYDYFQRPKPAIMQERSPEDYIDELPLLRAVLTGDMVITTGSSHSCALSEGVVRCFGDDDVGQVTVPELVNPRQVSAG